MLRIRSSLLRSTTAGSRNGSPVRLSTKTAIGTPQARWRLMHQSGRVSIIDRSHLGELEAQISRGVELYQSDGTSWMGMFSLHMMEMAVTRRTWKEPEYVLAPNERISVESAIRAMTSEAAWQLFSDHEIGSLEAGKLADFVILDADPRSGDFRLVASHQESLHSHDAVSVLTEGETFAGASLDPRFFETLFHVG